MVSENNKQKIYFNLFRISAFFSVAILIFVLLYTLINGAESLSWGFLTKMWSHNDITQGGILQAIIGSIFLGFGVAIFSVPIGISTAIYLNEYAQDNFFTRMIKVCIRNLAGVPSVVYGLFGLSLFVFFLKLGTSILSASLTLGCMTLPWIITSSEEALKAVPASFREGSLALGATKWQTIRRVVLPNSLSGMLTGSILGVSRAMGETAPIIMVGATFFMSYFPTSFLDKFMALPYHLFILATQHADPYARQYALGTALVLIFLIVGINLATFIFRYKLRKKKDW